MTELMHCTAPYRRVAPSVSFLCFDWLLEVLSAYVVVVALLLLFAYYLVAFRCHFFWGGGGLI